MNARISRYVSMAALLLILALLLTIHGPQHGPSVAEASTACFIPFNFGAGATLMNICLSDHGNLVKFESPAGFQQISQTKIFRDGYAICPGSPPVPENGGFDAGGDEFGFGPPTIIQGGPDASFLLSVMRDTTSGIYRLTQRVSRVDPVEQDVTITMTVRRLSTADCPSTGCGTVPVRLVRYFPSDVDNNPPAIVGRFIVLARTNDAVFVWVEEADPDTRPIGHGLMLSNRSFGSDHVPVVHTEEDHAAFKKNGCTVFAGQVVGPHGLGSVTGELSELVGYMFYGLILPNVNSEETRTVTYRRF